MPNVDGYINVTTNHKPQSRQPKVRLMSAQPIRAHELSPPCLDY